MIYQSSGHLEMSLYWDTALWHVFPHLDSPRNLVMGAYLQKDVAMGILPCFMIDTQGEHLKIKTASCLQLMKMSEEHCRANLFHCPTESHPKACLLISEHFGSSVWLPLIFLSFF